MKATKEQKEKWMKIRGNDLDNFIKKDPKGKYTRKLMRVPCFEDVWIQWLLHLQLLGAASWKTMADFSNFSLYGFEAQDYKRAILGGRFIEVVGSEIRRGKEYPVFGITDRGMEAVAFATEFHRE